MQMRNIIIIAIASLAFTLAAGPVCRAEAPCLQVSQESLRAMAACVGYARATNQSMDTHHQQLFSAAIADAPGPVPVAPYPYPGFFGGMPYYGVTAYGFRNTHLMWPNSWYYSSYPRW